MPYPWTLTITIAVVYYVAIIASLFSKRGKEAGREACFYYPEAALFTPFALFLVYYWYTKHAGGADPKLCLYFLCYLYFPPLLIWAGRKSGNKPCWLDAAAIALLWLPFDLHLDRYLIGKRPYAIPNSLDWPIIAVSSVIIALVFWVCLRKMDGTKAVFSFRLADLGKTFAALCALAVVLIPLGSYTGFLKLQPFWAQELRHSTTAEIVWRHLATKQFTIYLLKIFATIGLSEEFLFRGIIQNFLEKIFSGKTAPLLLASILFGAAHLNNGAQSIHLADWNWTYLGMATVAGMAYGLTFRYTRSILYPVLLHSLVDSIWHTLFS